ncbi:Cadherin [Dermatophagoides pteronyssinus]|uniref:Cadherin n=1 Tax=Dermatophagoides pteronyssinus TaxID=6956 RepID=A0ABQ8IR50_DERPT|nr:Cadherin [Dermatophagoides pteronyssinus]
MKYEPSISWLSSSSKLSTISTAIAPKHISNENIFNNNQSDFYQMPFNDQQQQEKIKSSSSTTLNKLCYSGGWLEFFISVTKVVVKALMINDSNGTISTSTTINQRKSGQNIDGGGGGNGVDYEHPEKSKFAINTFTGELFLISPLNRDPPDGREQYRLQIQAEDEHSEKINGSVTILIRVQNLAAGIDIIRLTAIDLDPDSILRYSIEVNRVNSDGDLIFDIDELSGLISTAVCCLDRESIAQYTIKICATDRSINGGDHHQQQQSSSIQSIVQQQQSMINQSSCTNVKINITDDNDEPPQFLRNHFYLSFMGDDNDDDQKIDGNIDDHNHHHHHHHHHHYHQNQQKHLNGINQLYAQQFDYYRQSLWNRFYQQYGGNGGFSSKNLLHLKDLIGFPDYVDLLLKISVSDLGYFEIPLSSSSSSSIQSIPSSSSSLQQRDYGELMLTLPHSQDSSSTTGTTSTTAGTNHNHQSYALYDLAQIANTAQSSSSSSLPQTQSATTGIISDEELIEMKSLMITANELHNPHQQYYSGHTSLMNNNDQNLPTITGSGTNLLLIQQQQTSMK